MAVTSGFFNSLNGDRKYDARQLSALFDGLINDGVYSAVGDALTVNATVGLAISVGSGKAWFNSTWLINDAALIINAEASELLQSRYDAVIIEIDESQAVRNGSIKIIKGTPSSTPQLPAMTKTSEVHQYPLAYIYRGADTNEITQANITPKIGSTDCPYASGVMDINAILTSLSISGGVSPGEQKVVNIIFYSGDPPSIEGVPNGTLFAKYVP